MTLTIIDTVTQQNFTLTPTPTTISGGIGNDVIVATNGVLYGGDTITLGGVGNTLVLQGDGTFKLQAPAALSGIQTVNLQGATSGRTVYLRDGLDLTVNVLDAANVAMVGAANDDVVKPRGGRQRLLRRRRR